MGSPLTKADKVSQPSNTHSDSDSQPQEDVPIVLPSPSKPSQGELQSTQSATTAPEVPWHRFILSASDDEIKERFARDIDEIVAKSDPVIAGYCILALLQPEESIDAFDLDTIYRGLNDLNGAHQRDVMLILLSLGGSIEPAYQISKLCKAFSKSKFVVCVPRTAKSAATLIALGADEIHMGILGQLGPIDPQLGGLPALGVAQALQTIASLSEKYPKSADMFSQYLSKALTVEQIGYCDRISESAGQYAERLLSAKPNLTEKASSIARHLVQTYKDHNFVIDLEEAQKYLGADWVKTNTPEAQFAESIYEKFDITNLTLRIFKSQRMIISGTFKDGGMLLNLPKRS